MKETAKVKITPGFGSEQLEKWSYHLLRWGRQGEEQVGGGRSIVLDML